jgi:hypothetical protein
MTEEGSGAAPHDNNLQSVEGDKRCTRTGIGDAMKRVRYRIELRRGIRSSIRNQTPDLSSHISQLSLRLFDVSARVQIGNVVERHEMKMEVRHAEAFDSNTDPFGVGGLFDWFR